MDIFTTALTRFIPVPIKPASLKVKALLKEARTSKLKEDPDHLENHDYYFGNDKNKQKEADQEQPSDNKQTETTHMESADTELKPVEKKNTDETESVVTESADGVKHLDLYV